MSKRTIQLPDEFKHPLFGVDKVTFDETMNKEELMQVPFLLDILDETIDRSTSSTSLFRRWREGKEEISNMFSQRNRQAARPKMIAGIGWFISLIYWTNKKKVKRLTHLKEELSLMEIQPVNLYERLSFLMENPDHYQSFIQLSQLYDELEKKWMLEDRKKQNMDNN
ncbi:YpoC family protein [Pseudalkalibacillus sp. R45]|uniref:YpoC family protein n=1 Tax=Pseudalkalibacillus sp. R45 TaxID=3457433 RepID=UPI003FCD7809